MDARTQLIQQYMAKMGIQKSRKRPRDDMVYKEVYKMTECQNTKMRSVYSNDVSSSSKEPSLKPEAKSSCIASSQVNPSSVC